MARIGQHHNHKPGSRGYSEFQKDLQADPLSFRWEYSEDDLDTRDWEKSLLAVYLGSPFCYNIGEGRYENRRVGWNHSDETIQKMKTSALKDSERRSKHLSRVVNTKEPCPHCGKLMNPGNLKQHLRAQTCKRK